ncbi:MAG: sulfatase-like hydrolase/transferase [Planctomycetales bacterium]|nr:sulfatase-like hydrolase/transferase [Planctomycetales bacterium]
MRACFLLLVIFCFCHPSLASPPNVVMIVSDDQGYHDLGCFGSDEVLTPHLDRLAAGGVKLTSFYVTWPACTPSRGSLLTGRYPQRNGTYDMIRNEAPDFGVRYDADQYAVTFERIGGMDTREVLLPQMLARAGYVSGIFGKWDLGSLRRYLPTSRGFDEFYGLVNTGIDFYTHERYGVPSMFRNLEPTVEDRGVYCTKLFEREALRFIEQHRHQPFFLYVPFNAPHGASNLDPKIRSRTQAPEKWRRLYPQYFEAEAYVEGKRYGQPAQVSNQAMRMAHYLGCVTAMDASIGKILDALDRHELAENTIVIFFSDNGGSGGANNRPLRGHKGQMFEGGVRVLSLARYPGRIPADTQCREFLTSLEWFPTLLNLAGVAPPTDVKLDGFDMQPVLAGDAPSARREMFWKRKSAEAARIDQWKWIRQGEHTWLFDLAADLSEEKNLADAMPQRAADMAAKFDAWLQETMVESPPRGPFKDF